MAKGVLAQRDRMDPPHDLLMIKGTSRIIGPFYCSIEDQLDTDECRPANVKKENSTQLSKSKQKKKKKKNHN